MEALHASFSPPKLYYLPPPLILTSGNCSPGSLYILLVWPPYPSTSYATVTLWIPGQNLGYTASFVKVLSVNSFLAYKL